MLIATLLVMLTAEPDAGFEPVIYSVHHGTVWLDTADGGFSDAPVALGSSVCMDEPTARWVAGRKADGRAEAAWWDGQDPWSMPGVRWLLGALGVGVLFGAASVGLLAWEFLR